MNIRMALVAGIAASICLPRAAEACGVDGASYAMRSRPEFTATFRRDRAAPSAHDLILEVRSATTGRAFAFRINRGNGYGEATLDPVKGHMAGRLELYTLNDAEAFTDYFGDVEGPAPKHLLAPKLGPALWYQIDQLTGVGNSEREQMPRAFFDRVACGVAG